MTDSFTLCCKSGWLERWLLLAGMALLGCIGPDARAQPVSPEITQLRLEHVEEGVQLSAVLRFDLPAVVEDALLKGVPMYFVAEASLMRERWYWYDKKVTGAARHMRLAYQPLTRRWRLNVAPGVIASTGLGATLSQSFDSMGEALATVQRISNWRIADWAEVDPESRFNVEFSFKLDVAQLPRPFQIGAVGQSDWNLSVSRTLRLEPAR